ncbi:ABC transporter ATP-binding protein [Candidatus Thorarchaeota archaeon]|nr:MAG: ABC transporter ATP-binding protein [Candidatus Thorarchaeota archaeon]
MASEVSNRILDIRNLNVYYQTLKGKVKAVQDVELTVECGEFVGISGESGCGKTTTAMTIMQLLPREGIINSGSICFKGQDILGISRQEVNSILWKELSMIFQGSMNALNPVHKVIDQMKNAILLHENVTEEEAIERSLDLLEAMGIERSRGNSYPHELSGGMKQRAMIALSLVCHPSLVIADEPTTALDVMIQAQILELLKSLKHQTNLSLILITHDLSVIAETCDRIVIMYAGRIVEEAPVEILFESPSHPYTRKLISSFPSLLDDREIDFIPGNPPDLLNPPTGCPYHPRCDFVIEKCREEIPPLESKNGMRVACFRSDEI